MPITMGKMWQNAKDSFETATGKSKPKEAKSLKNAFGAHTGLSGSLEKFDKADEAAAKTNNGTPNDCEKGKKYVAEMTTHLASFKKAKDNYVKTLDKSITDEIDKRTEVTVKTTYEKALKALSKELTALVDTGESRIASMEQRFDAAEKDLSSKRKVILLWKKNMSAAVARGAAAAARIKAKPTGETWNNEFPTAARDITMQLVIARDVDGLLADPDSILKVLKPYGEALGGPPCIQPKDIAPKDLMPFLAEFVKELKRADQLVHTKDAYS